MFCSQIRDVEKNKNTMKTTISFFKKSLSIALAVMCACMVFTTVTFGQSYFVVNWDDYTANSNVAYCPCDYIKCVPPEGATGIYWTSSAGGFEGDTLILENGFDGNVTCFYDDGVKGLRLRPTFSPVPPLFPTDTTVCTLTIDLDAGNYSQYGFTSYDWSTGASSQTVTVGPGTYSVDIHNVCGDVSATTTVHYENDNAPDLGPDIQVCNNEQVILNPQVENATTTTWYPGGINSPTLNVTTSGTYHCYVTDGNGCSGRDTIVVSIVAPTTADLCFVEFDTVSQKNNITWSANIAEAIQQVLIYKETALNEWTQIGTVNNGTFNYIDTESNPASQSYSYRITAVDSCGESVASSYHTTITLLSTYDLGTDTYGFTWSAYQGLTVSTYYLYGIKTDNSIDLIGSVPGNQYMYNYLNPDEAYVRYFVAFETQECGGTKDNVLVKSNWVQSVLTGIDYETALPFAIYPNPGRENISIRTSQSDYELSIYTLTGQQIINETNISTIDISDVSAGTYIVLFKSGDTVSRRKLVVE